MKNYEIYAKRPDENPLLNNGVASVTDARTAEELRTLRYELETFVCEGEYENGMRRILEGFLNHLGAPEQPGVWVSGFFGSGKSHFLKMLRALWVDFVFPEDNAEARGLAHLPDSVLDPLREITTRGRRSGGLHAASGSLGAGAGDNVRETLLAIVFRSAGLPEEYPLARFVMWLKERGWLEPVRASVEEKGKDWDHELKSLFVSPHIAKALLEVYPDMADSPQEARQLLKATYAKKKDEEVSSTQMVDAIHAALAEKGVLPLTLIALDEVQLYIGEMAHRAYAIQEMTEAVCKRFGGRLLFVGAGQTALTGTPMLQKLMGRFPTPIELSDADVEAVIRKVILLKRPDRIAEIDAMVTRYGGEISRQLAGTRLEHRQEDQEWLTPDYPVLPVRRRFWERTLRAVDQEGTAAQLRNQLKIVHEAARVTADRELGVVVAGDFIYNQIETTLLQTGVLPGEINERIQKLRAGGENDGLKARLCGLILLIGKLPRDPGFDAGVRSRPEDLADLLVEDLKRGGARLRKKIPALLAELEDQGVLMKVGDEHRLQTRESAAWNDEYRKHLSSVSSNPGILETSRTDLFRTECGRGLGGVKLLHGQSREPREPHPWFGASEPGDADQKLYVWIRDGWEEEEKSVIADARAAGSRSPMLYLYIPRRSSDELKRYLAVYYAAKNTLDVRGAPNTPEGQEARAAMETRLAGADARIAALVKAIFEGARIFQGGGREILGNSLQESLKEGLTHSLVRLYPQFDAADKPAFGKVIERVRQGDGDALEVVGWKGAPDKHPVCAAILSFIGSGGKGMAIRQKFEHPEYGWPRDAIDGCLYALLAAGCLRAADAAGKPVDARELARGKLPRTTFRVESTTISLVEVLAIRKLMHEIGIPCKPKEEARAIAAMIEEMTRRAERAGGEPPRPPRPPVAFYQDLQSLTGNDQMLEVYTHREKIAEEADAWAHRAREIEKRAPRWEAMQTLLAHAEDLPAAAEIRKQADAIYDQRLLLADPDPLTDPCDKAASLLRDALNKARDAFQANHEAEMGALAENDNWIRLDPDRQREVLADQGLAHVPDIETGAEKEILRTLEATPLGAWTDRTDALAGRFKKTRSAAARLLEPEVRSIDLPGRTLRDESDVREWLKEVEALLIDAVGKGPVEI